MRRVHIIIKGQVQGVFFRKYLQELAKKLKIKGWVRNIDNVVEVLIEGKDNEVADLLVFCAKGPEGAKVKSLDLDEEPYIGEFEDFTIEE
jgi:acylphosphatase